MTNTTEALKMAIKALEAMQAEAKARNCGLKICDDAIPICKEALESHDNLLDTRSYVLGMADAKDQYIKLDEIASELQDTCDKQALRIAKLESQEQEPVAYMLIDDGVCQQIEYDPDPEAYEYWVKDGYTPLYTHPAQPLSEWISVKEKLPNNIDRVLCYVEEITDLGKSHFIWNCSYNPAHGFNGQGKNGIVTHWMLLPNPPQIARAIEQAHGIGIKDGQ